MREQRAWLQEHHDDLRTFLMREPRGHRGMCGAMTVRPCAPEADVGVVFMDNHRYMDMCGHATIGLITAMVETGSLVAPPGEHALTMETPAGLVSVRYTVDDEGVREVTFRNVPSFYCATRSITLSDLGDVTLDVAYGGNVFALVDAHLLEVPVIPDALPRLKSLATEVLRKIDATDEILHPKTGERMRPTWVQFYDERHDPPKNVVIGAPRSVGSGEVMHADKVDRSPCGTGLSAKLALLHQRGKVGVGDTYYYESIIGSRFRGTIVARSGEGVIPEITGRAHVMALSQLVASEDDLFGRGFLLPEG